MTISRLTRTRNQLERNKIEMKHNTKKKVFFSGRQIYEIVYDDVHVRDE